MGKSRKRDTLQVNTTYLGDRIRTLFDGSKSKLAAATGVSQSAIYSALRGKAKDISIIIKLCDNTGIDYEKLITCPQSTTTEDQSHCVTDKQRPKILSLVSVKGGVGKTLIAINLAIELAQKCKVALVDVDIFTSGATRYLKNEIYSPIPLTFLDLAIGAQDTIASRKLLEIPASNSLFDENEGSLYFIPAYAHLPATSAGLNLAPTLIDWSYDDVNNAIESTIWASRKLGIDILIMDTHPGFLTLTEAICKVADCNLLVSDFDSATAHANWLLAWEINRRNFINSKIPDSFWKVALNRIPTYHTTKQCYRWTKESRDSAMSDWNNFNGDTSRIEATKPEIKEPALLLPDLEGMRLDHVSNLSATAIQKRGGIAVS